MMEKKYKLTDETIKHCGITLYRIEALHDFVDIKKGEKGGFVESEYNLSQEGNCWIFDNAKVYDEATVSGNAIVFRNAEVYNKAKVYGRAIIDDYAKVGGKAKVYGNASINDYAYIYGNAQVFDDALIVENALIGEFAEVYGKTKVMNYARVRGYAEVYGNAVVMDMAQIYGESKVYNNATITGNAHIYNAEIKDSSDYIVFKNWWSSQRYFIWTKNNNMWNVGCFYGTGEELITKAYRDSELSGREYERIVRYVESINQPAKILNRIQRIVCKLFNIK